MLRPDLLQHPNIPKPLHGLSPRSIKGQDWWNITRQKAYASTNYHCLACGIHKTRAKYHQWLEAHEDYDIDYKNGVMKIKEIVPLCHSCHNFIHSGRLWIVNKKTNPDKILDILSHGFKILEDNKLDVSIHSIYIAELMNFKHNSKYTIFDKEICPEWSQWCLILDGKKYYSKFKNMKEWQKYYKNYK